MADMQAFPIRRAGMAACDNRNRAIHFIVRFLDFAPAPTFAILAVWAGLFGSGHDAICMTGHMSWPVDDMSMMYLLMGAFHLQPWLKLWRGRLQV